MGWCKIFVQVEYVHSKRASSWISFPDAEVIKATRTQLCSESLNKLSCSWIAKSPESVVLCECSMFIGSSQKCKLNLQFSAINWHIHHWNDDVFVVKFGWTVFCWPQNVINILYISGKIIFTRKEGAHSYDLLETLSKKVHGNC